MSDFVKLIFHFTDVVVFVALAAVGYKEIYLTLAYQADKEQRGNAIVCLILMLIFAQLVYA